MKKAFLAAAAAASFILAGCASPSPPPTQGGITFESADEETPEAEPIGGAPDVDSVSKTEGSFGETMKGDHNLEVTVTYKGFQDPGANAYPSSSPAPVLEVAVKNGSDMVVGQGLVKYQLSYGSDSITDADLICGDTESFACGSNPPIHPDESTAVTSGFTVPVGSDVRMEIQIYFEDSQSFADFSVSGTVD